MTADVRGTAQIRKRENMIDGIDDRLLEDTTSGEDGLPCRHPDIDLLGTVATCPECGMILPQMVDSEEVHSAYDIYDEQGPQFDDEPDVDINPEIPDN